MAKQHQPYLQFIWNNHLFQFHALPFGLSSAPWCFTKVMRSVASSLREREIRLIVYLDDILIMSQHHSQILLALNVVMNLLESLGFIINKEKSILMPSRSLEFLGFTVDTLKYLFLLPQKKIAKIRKEIRSALKKRIPKGTSETPGPSFLLNTSYISGSSKLLCSPKNKSESTKVGFMVWRSNTTGSRSQSRTGFWLNNLDAWNGKAIFRSSPEFIVESDESLHGWGACLLNQHTGGVWSQTESSHHINYLELTTGLHALMSFKKSLQGRSVLLKNGQCIGSSLHKSIRRLQISRSLEYSQKTLDVLPRTQNCVKSRIPTWKIKHLGGLELQVPVRPQRLETQWKSIQCSQPNMGPWWNRLICKQIDLPSKELLQLDARPGCSSSKRLSPTLERNSGLHLSPFPMIQRILQKVRQ